MATVDLLQLITIYNKQTAEQLNIIRCDANVENMHIQWHVGPTPCSNIEP